MIKSGLWLELEAIIGFTVGLGLGSLIGQRTVAVVAMIVLEVVLTPIFSRANIPHFVERCNEPSSASRPPTSHLPDSTCSAAAAADLQARGRTRAVAGVHVRRGLRHRRLARWVVTPRRLANDDPRRLSNLFATLAREHVVVIPSVEDVEDIGTAAQVSPYAGFDAFVREHSQRLGRAAYLLTGDRHLAEDLVQTALAKVAIRWEQIVAKGDPAPYVRTVVIRTAIGWRRRRWHGEVPTSPLPETPDTTATRTFDSRDRLRRALLTVPPRRARRHRAPVLRGPQRSGHGEGHGLQRRDSQEPDRQRAHALARAVGRRVDSHRSGERTMSENDATRDDAEHRSLGAALTDLAATMPDDSYPVDDIHAKARHLRKRQRAARATVSVVAGAAVIAALVAVLPDRTPVSTTPASQVPIAEPSCADALAAAPPPPTPEEVQAAQAAKQAAAGDAPTNLRGIKARGTIVSTTDTSVTFTPDPQMPRGDQLGEITATVGPATEFYDGDTKVVTRPPLAAGDEAMFVASSADDGSYQLMVLAVHVPENVGSPTDGRPGREVGQRRRQRRSREGCGRGGLGAAGLADDPIH